MPPVDDWELDVQRARRALQDALERPADLPELEIGSLHGPYRLEEELGRGGMGVVFRAHDLQLRRDVAIKFLLEGPGVGPNAEPQERLRFLFGAEAAANLNHPNVVPVYHVGELEGRVFFTMRLLPPHCSLAESATRFSFVGEDAIALLVAKVAHAVQHAHDRGILHCDLKPANILIDHPAGPHASPEPCVADFGLARRMQPGELEGSSHPVAGTLWYMAPEQARGDKRLLTRRTDLWSLGVILYELLTKRLPYPGAFLEVYRDLTGPAPVPPLALSGRLSRDLERICLKCLQKDPEDRYVSAAALAADLEAFCRGAPVSAAPTHRIARLVRWGRRNPVTAVVAAGLTFLLLATGSGAVLTAQAQEEELRREISEANMFAARATADQVLLHLRNLGDRVRGCADNPAVVGRLAASAAPDPPANPSEPILKGCGLSPTFDSVLLLNREGLAISRTPTPTDATYLGRDFSFRNYFQGARELGARGVRSFHVGRAHRSEADGQFKISLGAPVFGPPGPDGHPTCLGVLMTTIGTDATLDSLPFVDSADEQRMAALMGLRDRERSEATQPLPQELMLLIHQGLAHGNTATVPPSSVPVLQRAAALPGADHRALASHDYIDPLAHSATGHDDSRFGGRWLAGVARVGDTANVVVVQTRYTTVSAIQRLLWRALVASGAVTTCLAAALFYSLRRSTGSRRSSRN